ncbi:MAG: hypothetical protein WC485_04875, partial [Opitutaceae bacterium]
SPEGEPVFALARRPIEPDDDYIQPDAPYSVGAQLLAPGSGAAKLEVVSASGKSQFEIDSARRDISTGLGNTRNDIAGSLSSQTPAPSPE